MLTPRFYLPTPPAKRLSLIDLINRRAAATGSPGYAMATAGADYNGHNLSLYWNDYRGYYVLDYHWGERVVLHRGTDFAAALVAAKREFARQGRGASLRISPRDCDVEMARQDGDLVEGDANDRIWHTTDQWRVDELSFAILTHNTHHLIKAGSLEDFRALCRR
jgi:hypothetical protein